MVQATAYMTKTQGDMASRKGNRMQKNVTVHRARHPRKIAASAHKSKTKVCNRRRYLAKAATYGACSGTDLEKPLQVRHKVAKHTAGSQLRCRASKQVPRDKESFPGVLIHLGKISIPELQATPFSSSLQDLFPIRDPSVEPT